MKNTPRLTPALLLLSLAALPHAARAQAGNFGALFPPYPLVLSSGAGQPPVFSATLSGSYQDGLGLFGAATLTIAGTGTVPPVVTNPAGPFANTQTDADLTSSTVTISVPERGYSFTLTGPLHYMAIDKPVPGFLEYSLFLSGTLAGPVGANAFNFEEFSSTASPRADARFAGRPLPAVPEAGGAASLGLLLGLGIVGMGFRARVEAGRSHERLRK